MKWVITPLLLIAAAAYLSAKTSTTKKLPQNKTASSSGKKAALGKSATSHKSTKTAHGRHHTRPAAPAYQLHPDSDRYAEIQKALADRGYFKGEVNGQWKDDSVDALRRFQTDQKLDSDGKIDSLTLIGLGLGPKHDGSLVTPHPAPAATAPATAPTDVTPPSSASTQETAPAPFNPPN